METYAFIDASNLFYGGEKRLGWKIDYKKLIIYLKKKYQVKRFLYFGGVEIYGFEYNYLKNETVPLVELSKYLSEFIKKNAGILNEAELILIGRHLKRVGFYRKLEEFGYELYLKPVKLYEQEDGTTRRKANCDVEMSFCLMRDKDKFDRAVILSGDGDFLPVLKYLKEENKDIVVLARGERAAREIRLFAKGNFRDFVRLENTLKYEGK
ncbi:MAG: NYN domain-containing protein [Candidatus Paceibacterota bacterium]